MTDLPHADEGDDAFAWYEAMLEDPPAHLLVPAVEGAAGVSVEIDAGGRECRIWQGYLDASGILLERMLEGGPFSEALIFPAMFALRHGLEVALKWHIRNEGGVVPRRAGHDLDVLADALRRAVTDVDAETALLLDALLDHVAEVAALDPRAIAFRYPTGLDGAAVPLPRGRWDLRSLRFTVDQLSLWFDNLSDWIMMGGEEWRAMMRDVDIAAEARVAGEGRDCLTSSREEPSS